MNASIKKVPVFRHTSKTAIADGLTVLDEEIAAGAVLDIGAIPIV